MIKRLLDVWQQKKLQMRFEKAIVDTLEDVDRRLYALEENRKQKDAAILQMQDDIRKLRTAIAGKVSV